MFSKQLLALALSVAATQAVYQGFNYGSTKGDGSSMYQSDFQTAFQTAKNLVGTNGAFTSARLYTMIQGGTTNSPIEAIPAAIAEDTSLLLGLWASGGNMDNEIAALKNAINQYGSAFGQKVAGISVGSEDLYRNSVTGTKNHAGIGEQPAVLVDYIKQVRSAIAGTSLSGALIGHVDTWDAWTNSSNADVIQQLDWLGVDEYPYYELMHSNGINNAKNLFDDAWQKTVSVAGGRQVWMTESGWPLTGPNMGQAVPSVANAKTYWDEVACPLFGNTNTWWYILSDEGASPSFGLTDSLSNPNPLFDLTCKASTSTSSSAASGSTSTAGSSSGSSSSGSSSTGSGSSGSKSAPTSTGASSSSGNGASSAGSSNGSSGGFTTTVQHPTPLGTASSTSGSGSGSSSGSGSGSGSSSTAGSSSSGSSSTPASGGSSSSSTGSSPSASPTFNSASRATGSSIFGAVAAILALAIAV